MFKNLDELRKIEFNEREKHLENAIPQELIYTDTQKVKLNITYVMTWTGICGGSKIILEHANRLTKMGHTVTLISHYPRPDWFPLDENVRFIQVPWKKVLCKSIPKCDIIVATYWREIYECIEQKIAPVIYFEQGDFHLFDLSKVDDRLYKYIEKELYTTKFVYTVSTFAKDKLQEVYNKESIVIPNAVDDKIFYYKPHKENDIITISIIGSEDAKFKRISDILEAIKQVKEDGYEVKLNWITPTAPIESKEEAIINPKQIIIGDTLRNTDIYVCASIYESFCLPVLEAMTCGAAVITTNNGGNMDFVKDGYNALLVEKDNIKDIADKIKILIKDDNLRNKIASNGVKKSKEYSWEITMEKIESYYKEVAKYEVK